MVIKDIIYIMVVALFTVACWIQVELVPRGFKLLPLGLSTWKMLLLVSYRWNMFHVEPDCFIPRNNLALVIHHFLFYRKFVHTWSYIIILLFFLKVRTALNLQSNMWHLICQSHFYMCWYLLHNLLVQFITLCLLHLFFHVLCLLLVRWIAHLLHCCSHHNHRRRCLAYQIGLLMDFWQV